METLQRTANRGSISTGYDIDNSLKLEHDNSEELNFTPSSSGSNQTWTFSCWFKGTELDLVKPIFGHYTSADNQALVRILSTNEFSFRLVNGGAIRELKSDMLFKDTSAWYHLVVAVDTTDGTSTNRVKVYINGSQITLTGTYPTPSLVTYGINTSSLNMDIGGITTATPTFFGFCGYLAEINHIDGQQLAPTDFGETDEDTGIWKPIEYTGTYGTNGAYLKFSNSSSLGEDSAGSNDWTLNNITSADQATDTPTNNFCIINPNFKYPSSQVISEGNTEITRTSGTGHNKVFFATIPVGNGKWYAEFEPQVTNGIYGVCTQERPSITVPDSSFIGEETGDVAYYYSDGNKYVSGTSTSYGNSYAAGDVMGIALDMDNRYVYFAKNGTWQNSGDPTSGSSGTGGIALPDTDENYMMAISYSTGGNWYANWGGYTLISIASGNADGSGYGNFEYAPPSGYYALCTKNLAEYG